MPPSYSNRYSVDPHDAHDTHPSDTREHDISWESEVSRADTSVLSHDVGDFAEADAYYELHGNGAEVGGLRQSHDQGEGPGQSLDAAGLTMGIMGFIHAQQPPSQPVPNQRYQEALRGSFEDNKHDEVQHYKQEEVHEDPPALQDLRESHEPQSQGTRQRSNSLNSASMTSTHSGRSSHRGSTSKSQPSRMKYSGITDIKISHKLKPGDVLPARSVAPSTGVNTAARNVPVSAGSRTLRTPSPMTRLTSANGTSKRTSSASRSRPLSSGAAVVTPNTGTASSKGRLISTSGSVLKKTPKDKSVLGSGHRRQSLMY